MGDLIGQSLGRYHILEQLGEGGMATVYKAFDTRLEADVAVKVIRTEKFTPEVLARALKRFEREAKALARLTHPNIVKVSDYGEFDGSPYLVMPYLPGGNLKQLLKERGRIPWQEAAKLLLPIAEALDYAHDQNVIHRDVKPSNILLTERGQPMLTDFGVAKVLEEEATIDLTGTAMAVGTPEYMAPEQASAKTADQRADIYALGIVFYEMLTGRRPFEADTPLGVIIKQASEPLPRPRQFVPDLPERTEQILIKALAKKPENRYQHMGDLAAALEGLTAVSEKPRPEPAPSKQEIPARAVERDVIPPHPPARAMLKWLPIVGLVLLLGLGLALGSGLLNMGRKGLGPLGGLATDTATATPTRTPTPTYTPTPTPGIGSTWTRPADGMVMVYVPEGEFTMGSNNGDSDEQPVHTVYLDAYWIDQTEVTNAMFTLFVERTGYQTDAEGIGSSYVFDGTNWNDVSGADWQHPQGPSSGLAGLNDHPVVHVSWNDAEAYCGWAGVRLPSEAEWEKAARGIDGRTYPWGNQSLAGNLLNFADINLNVDWADRNVDDGYQFTAPVGSYPAGASPYGALDMAGNVWEWVEDWYGETYYSQSPESNPTGPASGQYRVLRGGSWVSYGVDLRSAYRYWGGPDLRNYVIGFRCVLSP